MAEASQNETIDGVWRDWAYTANKGIEPDFVSARAPAKARWKKPRSRCA